MIYIKIVTFSCTEKLLRLYLRLYVQRKVYFTCMIIAVATRSLAKYHKEFGITEKLLFKNLFTYYN